MFSSSKIWLTYILGQGLTRMRALFYLQKDKDENAHCNSDAHQSHHHDVSRCWEYYPQSTTGLRSASANRNRRRDR